MAKISITKFIKRQKKIRIATILGLLVVAVVFGQWLIRNPKPSQAATLPTVTENGTQYYYLTGNWYIKGVSDSNNINRICRASNENDCPYTLTPQDNLKIESGTITTRYIIKLNSIIISDDAVLTHEALEQSDFALIPNTLAVNQSQLKSNVSWRKQVNITAENITFRGNGTINVDGKGAPGGKEGPPDTLSGFGPGGGVGKYISSASTVPNHLDNTAWIYQNGNVLSGCPAPTSRYDNEVNRIVWERPDCFSTYLGAGSGGGNHTAGGKAYYSTNRTDSSNGWTNNFSEINGGISTDLSFKYGSGGGAGVTTISSGHADNSSENNLIIRTVGADGGNGGGSVSLNSGSLSLSKNALISANGNSGRVKVMQDTLSKTVTWGGGYYSANVPYATDNIYAVSGSGSGGYINITADNLQTWTVGENKPDVSGGLNERYSGYNGSYGKYYYNNVEINENSVTGKIGKDALKAKGADSTAAFANIVGSTNAMKISGGAGAGGVIKVDVQTKSPLCYITGSTIFIPDSCENQDVVIDGFYKYNNQPVVVDAGFVKVGGDSKRRFKSLSVINGATLTHSEVSVSDLSGDVINSTGSGRWKKVDIEVTGDIRLESGGKIDVSGKGYPGGSITTSPQCPAEDNLNGVTDGYGPGFGKKFHKRTDVDPPYAGAGGFGGDGGDGTIAGSGGGTYDNTFDFGSGGGAAYAIRTGNLFGSGEDWGCSTGGNGGGRIRLIVNGELYLDASSGIYANGNPITDGDRILEGQSVNGGAGSGGQIILSAGKYNFAVNNTTADVAAKGFGGGADGIVRFINFSGRAVNISASGGEMTSGGGGGGRITITQTGFGSLLKKTIESVTRDGSQITNNYYDLQMGDTVTVKIDFSQMADNHDSGATFTLTDQWLQYSEGGANYYCEPLSAGGTNSDKSTYWTGVSVSDGSKSYDCKIKKE